MISLILGSLARADDEPKRPSVFELPVLGMAQAAGNQAVAELFAKGEYARAVELLQKAVERVPHDFNSHYNLACALARLGKADEALATLDKAVELGFRDRKHIEEDEDLKPPHGNERFRAIATKAAEPPADKPSGWNYEVKPREVVDGEAIVGEDNVAYNPQLGVFRVLFKLDREATKDKPICEGFGKAGELLRQWAKEGTAAGNHGDLYDNHDGDHANMNYKAFPQLTRIEFAEEAKKHHLHIGLQSHFFYNGVVIGNSSTALTSGPFWRCQGRNALTSPRGPALLYLQYIGNHLYFYPEHRDHDPGHNGKDGQGHGDVFPANTPYMILSQGSSGSDVAFMNAVAATLAAFRPEVKQELAKAGMLMPTVQMIFRRSYKLIEKPEDYLTGKAHPTVFEGSQIDAEKMVTLAHEMTLDTLPPLVQLKVTDEDKGVVGRDYFDVGPRESLFDTPCAIARVVKSTKYLRRMVVSAEACRDLRGKPLTLRWAVLRGDAERIKINTLDDRGAKIELLVPYHERRPIAPQAKIESNRVDIGVFADNGAQLSAPAFVCFFYLDNEKRVYDDKQRIVTVDYTDAETKDNYVDPLVDMKKDWRDDYRYADDGTLLGWTRTRGEKQEEFTPDGRLILEKDDKGQPVKTAAVRYVAKSSGKSPPTIEQTVEGK